MKRLLVLGTGNSQIDMIEAAHKLGIEVYGVAKEENGPGQHLLDGFKQVDILDTDAIANYAKEIKADAIYSMGLELAIKPIAIVSEELGLPCFYNTETLKLIEDKATWRQVLGDIEGNVKFKRIASKDDLNTWDIYPAIIKPVDSSGQRGVHKVENLDEAIELFDLVMSYSPSKQIIVEQYVDGPEISVNSYMEDGELIFALVSDRISYSEYPGGIIKEHHIPVREFSQDIEQQAIDLVEKVNKKLNFNNGQIYYQMKVEDNRVYLIEFMPRFDGCHMWNLIRMSTGIDLLTMSLERLLYNKSAKSLVENYQVTPVKTKFISDKPGTIVDRKNYDIPSDTLVLDWYYENGDQVKSVTGYLEKMGYFIVSE